MAYEEETETIQSLLDIMHEHDLDRIKVKIGDAVYELVRREAGAQIVAPMTLGGATHGSGGWLGCAGCAAQRQARHRTADRRLLSLVLSRCPAVRRTGRSRRGRRRAVHLGSDEAIQRDSK
jgi:hypothetical protein